MRRLLFCLSRVGCLGSGRHPSSSSELQSSTLHPASATILNHLNPNTLPCMRLIKLIRHLLIKPNFHPPKNRSPSNRLFRNLKNQFLFLIISPHYQNGLDENRKKKIDSLHPILIQPLWNIGSFKILHFLEKLLWVGVH